MTADLITKLEAATEGSRELCEAIQKSIWEPGMTTDHEYTPPYSQSIDAKLPWENIILTGMLFIGDPKKRFTATHQDTETGELFRSAAATEPLARRAAAMKAIEALKAKESEPHKDTAIGY